MNETFPATKADLLSLQSDMHERFASRADLQSLQSDIKKLELSTTADTERLEVSMSLMERRLHTTMDERFTAIDQRFIRIDQQFAQFKKYMDDRFTYSNQGIDQVLTVLANIDKRLTGGFMDHEKRITRLEKVIA